MKTYTNLKEFMDADIRECRYRHRLTQSRVLKVLLGNRLHAEYAKSVVSRIKAIHDKICQERMVLSIPSKEWVRMRRRITSLAKSVQPKERLNITVYFEFNDNYELSVVLCTKII